MFESGSSEEESDNCDVIEIYSSSSDSDDDQKVDQHSIMVDHSDSDDDPDDSDDEYCGRPLSKKRKVVGDDDDTLVVMPLPHSPIDIEEIPSEILFHNILSFIPLSKVLKLRLTCKYMNQTIVNEWLSAENCSLIPRLHSRPVENQCNDNYFFQVVDHHNLDCFYNFTNLMVESHPEQHLLEFYQKFKKVKKLYCYRLVDTFLMKDVAFERLQTLYLNDCELNGADILALSQSSHFYHLKTLNLHHNKLRGHGNLHLLINSTICPSLESLIVSENQLSDEFVVQLFTTNENNSNNLNFLPSKLHTLITTKNSITIHGQLTLLYNTKKQLKILFIDGLPDHDGDDDDVDKLTTPLKLPPPNTLEYLHVTSKVHFTFPTTNNNTKITYGTSSDCVPKIDGKYMEHTAIHELFFDYRGRYDKFCSNLAANHPVSNHQEGSSSSSLNTLEQYFYWERAIQYYLSEELWDDIAMVYYKLMRPPNYKKARKYFQISGLDYYDAEIATCYFKMGDYRSAIRKFESLLEFSTSGIDKLSPGLLEIYGTCCYHVEDYLTAVELLSEIVTFSSDDSMYAFAHSLLKTCKMDEQKKQLALQLLNSLVVNMKYQKAIELIQSMNENQQQTK